MSYKTWSPSFTSYAQSRATKGMKLENLDPDLGSFVALTTTILEKNCPQDAMTYNPTRINCMSGHQCYTLKICCLES